MKLNQILPLFTVIIFVGIAIRVLRGPSTPEVARAPSGGITGTNTGDLVTTNIQFDMTRGLPQETSQLRM